MRSIKLNRLCLYLALVIYNFSYSQSYTIIDSLSKEPIAYVNVLMIKDNSGFYSNEQGLFKLSNISLNDSISISCLGYKTILEKVKNLKDTIYLPPKFEQLDDINLSTKKPVIKKVGFKKNKLMWYPEADFQIGMLLKPAKNEKAFVNKITIRTNKSLSFYYKEHKKTPNYNSIIKLMLFSIKDNLPNKPLLTKPIIINCSEKSDKNIEVDLSEEFIIYDVEGLFIAVEMVGELDTNGNVIVKKVNRPGLVFSNIPSDDFSLAKLFAKPKSTEKWVLLDAKKMHEKRDFLLALELELTLYNE
ncbi:carboxypeptidase-like regulatory domain-containing protein [Aureibaculum marinum]|uniref:carboxypeptidase-like regulatory domain-containing protein n=1 Tax=Aureibaculum marinum TaxID=2487930 RepID=UPI0013966A27|nr:carboxypeptidase-like regulatory domain-containing protein [Aureibaculum marinum]